VPTRDLSRPVLLAHCGILAGSFIVFAVAWQQARMDAEEETLISPACVYLAALGCWSLVSWRLVAKAWFDPYSVFLAAAYAFNAGRAVLEVFHLNRYGLSGDWYTHGEIFPPSLLLQTLLLVALALSVMHLGALFAAACRRRAEGAPADPGDESVFAEASRWVGGGLLAVSVPFTALLLREAVAVVIASGYMGLYQQQAATGVGATPDVLSMFLVPGTLFLLAGSKGRPGMIAVTAAVILANGVCRLFLGARYHAIFPVVAYLWVFHVRIRPLPRGLLLGGGALLLGVVFPLVRMTRNQSGEDRFSVATLQEAYVGVDNPAIAVVSEMGGSMGTVSHTLELVPGEREHDMGVVYLYALSTLVPNLFWDLHPAVAYGTPSSWLIRTVDPWTAAQGGSLGYSFIAEAYLSFGWWGVPVVLGAVGFLFAKFLLWGRTPGPAAPAKVATVASFFTFFTFFAREETALIVRPLVWYSLLPCAAVYLLARYRARRGVLASTMVLHGGARA
jgi:oligosaccharide repeat unit polymerase